VEAVFDTLDDANFPRSGYLVGAAASATNYRADGGAPVRAARIEAQFPYTIGRLTFLGLAAAARSRDDRGAFDLGGFLGLSGTPTGSLTGSQTGFAALLAYYRMGELPRVVGTSWYAGVSVEAGNAWNREGPGRAGVKKAGSVFVGIDSIIGPLYFAYGRTAGGDSSFYFFLGRPVGL
jgi:NTE family protein